MIIENDAFPSGIHDPPGRYDLIVRVENIGENKMDRFLTNVLLNH